MEQVAGDGTVLSYLQDQLGSTRGLTDSTGTLVGTFSYDAYGTLTSSTGTATTPFLYAGQYTDSESGLQYLRARYYDPATSQFLSIDPLVGVTQQPYSYAGDNPTNWVDASGVCKAGPVSLPVGGSGKCSDDVGRAVEAASSEIAPSGHPAYVGGCFSAGYILGGQACLDVSRAGAIFFTPAAGLTTPGYSLNVHGGYIHGAADPTPCQTNAYLGGPTLVGTLTAVLSVSGVWGNEGRTGNSDYGDELGIGWPPSASLMQGYGFRLPGHAPSWR